MADHEEKQGSLAGLIQTEIRNYLSWVVQIGEQVDYSQSKLTRRIELFETHTYPTGKFDSQENYKFWFDIISPRIDAEVKNVDFDTKNVEAFSPRLKDELPIIVINLKVGEYLRDTGQAEEINDALEEGSGWGNVVWKKVKKAYERVDLRNFYIINQAAKTLDETATIERHEFQQPDLRAKAGVWNHIDEIINDSEVKTQSSQVDVQSTPTETPYYEIFERNGDVNLKDLKEHLKKEPAPGDENKYVFAKIIAFGKSESGSLKIKKILFASDQRGKMSDIFKEYHRGRYKGKWFREGQYELLFDLQVRANQIGNQIARGLEWASKVIFASDDTLIVQNILTELDNGDLIETKGIKQIEVRLQGFDQLVADWNRIIQLANDIVNSREIISGENPPSGQPFRLAALLNQNANKLFTFIREKFAIPLSQIFEEWILPGLIKKLKAEEILRLTGDSDMLDRFMQVIVGNWYRRNLLKIGPHSKEAAQALQEAKLEELKKRPQLLLANTKKLWEDVKPHVIIDITGEGLRLPEDLESLKSFIQLEVDPVRRSAMIELAMRKKGIDVGALPKSPPQPLPTERPTPAVATVGAEAEQ